MQLGSARGTNRRVAKCASAGFETFDPDSMLA
jgi:hypothetical protein